MPTLVDALRLRRRLRCRGRPSRPSPWVRKSNVPAERHARESVSLADVRRSARGHVSDPEAEPEHEVTPASGRLCGGRRGHVRGRVDCRCALRHAARPLHEHLHATLDLGDLRRVTPIDSGFGRGRGKPVDRHGIESSSRCHARNIRGRVLEVAEERYTSEFGGARVTRSDILHVDDSNPQATLIGDLADDADDLPGAASTASSAPRHSPTSTTWRRGATIHRILKPGGVLLTTVPGISQMSPYDRDRWGEYWRFTAQSLGPPAGRARSAASTGRGRAYGNVLASTALLQGLCVDDLRRDELDHRDQRYQMLIAARASQAERAAARQAQNRAMNACPPLRRARPGS